MTFETKTESAHTYKFRVRGLLVFLAPPFDFPFSLAFSIFHLSPFTVLATTQALGFCCFATASIFSKKEESRLMDEGTTRYHELR